MVRKFRKLVFYRNKRREPKRLAALLDFAHRQGGTSAKTNVASLMIGERGARLILGDA